MATPGSTNGPSVELKAAIDSCFGSLEAMQAQFNKAAAGRFGSGWAWLGVGADGRLIVTSTANQDNPLMRNVVETTSAPILGLDVWEHAYYLTYQNRRPEYIAAFWEVVNWDFVNDNFAAHATVRIYTLPNIPSRESREPRFLPSRPWHPRYFQSCACVV